MDMNHAKPGVAMIALKKSPIIPSIHRTKYRLFGKIKVIYWQSDYIWMTIMRKN